MMYVLDTNVLSELRKVRLGKADANVTAWAESVDAADLFVSAITIMEVELGVLSIERKDATQGAMLRAWLDQHVLPEFSGRTLPIDTAVAQRCARLHVPDKRGERDALIAATALVHGMTVVTRNVADFKPTGVTIVNPWAPSVTIDVRFSENRN
ncbi:type II toxin-antitoxin system VapC family toxin [Castellaniella caeni]|uniref:type II toxin-antitoxin system VapC family toxin n=1 Tax=Castellaniella caeni TaxID=266123 RepID=UPI000A82284F|nr:type II toxin-antitoxin system VapC family toxin [Castellaniella caeni]